MKFILSLIFCCAMPSSRPVIRHRTFSSRRNEEVRSLMRQSSTASERTITRSSSTSVRRSSRGGKLSGIGSKSMSAQWKPSLCAISEDRAVYVMAGNGERTPITTPVEKKLAGKSSVQKAKIRVRDFNDNDFIRRSPSSSIIQAFSPTVFLF